MTIAMPDSIYPANLPPGYEAYLGYADGRWPTGMRLSAQFPRARIVTLTVTGATLNCDGIDCEPGNPDAASAARWAKHKLDAVSASRPVVYASVRGQAGYGMPDVLSELAKLGIARSDVRLLSAHYTDSPHVCGPATCGAIPVAMDGTQWTAGYGGLHGAKIDMSALEDGFFGAAPPAPVSQEDELMARIPEVKQGDSGQAVRNWQALLEANGYSLAPYGFDGKFGPLTDERTRAFQTDKHIAVDGVAGPQTYTAALT